LRFVSAEPASGSDIEIATIKFPEQISGKTLSRISDGANSFIAKAGPKLDSKTGKAIALEILANSSKIRTASK
jgi:hypothetical protein